MLIKFVINNNTILYRNIFFIIIKRGINLQRHKITHFFLNSSKKYDFNPILMKPGIRT